MKIKNVIMTDTGNGPCVEIQGMDGSYLWISDLDGCGLPTKNSWAVGHYNEDHDCMRGWNSEEYLWMNRLKEENESIEECKQAIFVHIFNYCAQCIIVENPNGWRERYVDIRSMVDDLVIHEEISDRYYAEVELEALIAAIEVIA